MGGFGSWNQITSSMLSLNSISAGDLDGDGDQDVLACSGRTFSSDVVISKVAWIQNNGTGHFSSPIILTTALLVSSFGLASDLDNDGDLDIVAASFDGNRFNWFRNLGAGVFAPMQLVAGSFTQATSLIVADINGDGARDFVASLEGESVVVWYRNRLGVVIPERTSTLAQTHYQVGVISTFAIVTRDVINNTGAIGSVSVSFVGPVTFAGGAQRSTDGYLITFLLPERGVFSVEVAVDDESVATFQVTAVPISCDAGLRVNKHICVPCDEDQFQANPAFEGSACSLCGNQTSTHGATGAKNCSCIAGLYSLSPGKPCLDCPAGAFCAGAGAMPVPQRGYDRVGSTGEFGPCPRPQSCLGAAGCARGYRGPFCKDCESAYYADASGECRSCPGGSKGLLATYILLVIGLSIAASLVVLFSMTRVGGESKNNVLLSSVYRSRKFPPSIPLIISAFQVVGILAVANLSWPASAQGALNTFNLFSLDINLFASECSLSSFSGKYAMAVFTPAVFSILVVAEILLLRVGRRFIGALADLAEVKVGAQCLAVLFLVGPLGYLPVSRTTLALFDCTKLVDGRYYLDADMSMQCFGPRWWALLPIGLFGCVAYVIAVPGAIAVTMYLNRASLFTDVSVIRSFGSVYKLFRRPYTFMPLALLGKKLAIAIWSLFFSRLQAIQFAGLFFILFGGGFIQMYCQAYYFPIYDRMEMVFTGLLSGLLVCGMMMYSSTGQNKEANSSVLVVVVVFALVIALLAFSLYFVYCDIRDFRRDMRASGQAGDNSKSMHAKRLRAFANSNLRDLDDPVTFLTSLAVTRDGSERAS
eukprot:c20411_g1_i1.p1 GENE.c20411_g1_i1~~c20411_g1_i1.p1  ORF type:complete len:924 (+),score=139.09 c20411_g1_i1:322-2772(+)